MTKHTFTNGRITSEAVESNWHEHKNLAQSAVECSSTDLFSKLISFSIFVMFSNFANGMIIMTKLSCK